MKLTEKYEILEKLQSKNGTFYKTKDCFNNIYVFIEKYQEIPYSDWNAGTRVNEELKKLRLSNKIDDYFYADNKEKRIKIFYKVYLNNPLEIEQKLIKNHIMKTPSFIKNLEEENTLLETAIQTSKHSTVKPKNIERIMICRKCKTEISLRNFNNTSNTAYCNVCHKENKVIFKEIGGKKERANHSRYINIDRTNNKLLIKIRKSRVEVISLLAIAMFIILFRLLESDNIFETFEIYLFLGIVIVLISIFLDKNYIDVSKGLLKVYSKPFSITELKKIKVKDIEQLYVKRGITKGAYKRTIINFSNNRANKRNEYVSAELDIYNLIVILKNGKGELSIFETHNSNDALYLEKIIEKYLNIIDVEVAKEIV